MALLNHICKISFLKPQIKYLRHKKKLVKSKIPKQGKRFKLHVNLQITSQQQAKLTNSQVINQSSQYSLINKINLDKKIRIIRINSYRAIRWVPTFFKVNFLKAFKFSRYGQKLSELREIFSEYALIKYRVYVEICWFEFLQKHLKEISNFTPEAKSILNNLKQNFKLEDAIKVTIITFKIKNKYKGKRI